MWLPDIGSQYIGTVVFESGDVSLTFPQIMLRQLNNLHTSYVLHYYK